MYMWNLLADNVLIVVTHTLKNTYDLFIFNDNYILIRTLIKHSYLDEDEFWKTHN